MPASSFQPAPDGSPLSDNDRRALTRFLEQSLDHGFRLAIVEAAGHGDREAILAGLAPAIGDGLLRIAVDRLPGAETNLWAALQEPFAAQEPRCLALWGFEELVGSEWARQLNVQRDLFVRDFAVPWLLFIHPASRVRLMQEAPDFCDFAILWVRDGRQFVPVGSIGMATQDGLSLSEGLHADDPLLHKARNALDAAEFDSARDALSQFDLQPGQGALDRVRRQLLGVRLEHAQGRMAVAEACAREVRSTLARLPASVEVQELARVADGELANILSQSGRYAEAEELLRRTLLQVERTEGSEVPEYGVLLNNLANVLARQGRLDDAERAFKAALAIHEKSLGRGHPFYVSSLNGLANVLSDQGKYADAEHIFREVVVVREKAAPEHPDHARSLQSLAGVLLRQGRYAEAEQLLRASMPILKSALGEEHRDYGVSLHNLASVLSKQGKDTDAERVFRESLSVLQEALGREHPNYGATLHALAVSLFNQGRFAEAEEVLREALSVVEKALGSEHPTYGAALQTLGASLISQGKFAEAERSLRESLAIHERSLGSGHPRLCQTLAYLATAVASQMRVREGIRFLERALAIGRAALGDDHPEVLHLRRMLEQLRQRRE